MRRINRELDMTNFVRKQLMMSGLLKALTSMGQRALMRRQYSLMVPGAHDGDTTTDTASDYDFKDY